MRGLAALLLLLATACGGGGDGGAPAASTGGGAGSASTGGNAANPPASGSVGGSGGAGTTATGGSTSSSPTVSSVSSGSRTYSATAGIGEFVTYSVNLDSLTYSYTIVDSAFGLGGRSASGALTRNADGTYTPAGFPSSEARVLALNNGLLLGAIRENFGAGVVTVPVIGVSNPIATLSEAAGVYNFVEYVCQLGICASFWGTFQLQADGSYRTCLFQDFSASCPINTTGILNSLGNGKWQIAQSGLGVLGAALMFRSSSSSQKVLLIDLHAPFAKGFVVGAEQTPIQAADYEAKTWVSAFFSPARSVAHTFTTGTDGVGAFAQPAESSAKVRLDVNSPFTGFITTSTGERAVLAGTGVYAATGTTGSVPFAEFGIVVP